MSTQQADPCSEAVERATQNSWWLYCSRSPRRPGALRAVIEVDAKETLEDNPDIPYRGVYVTFMEAIDLSESAIYNLVEWMQGLSVEEFQRLVDEGSMIRCSGPSAAPS